MNEQICSECKATKFYAVKTKTTMNLECINCGTHKVFYVEEWI